VTTRAAALLTIAAGVVTMALSQVFAAIDATLVSANCAEPGLVVRFQLAGADAVQALFADGACGAERARSAHLVNTIDIRLFIGAYVLFLIGAARILAGRWRSALAIAAIVTALGAGLADAKETLVQLAVTSAPDIPAAIARAIDTILWSARAKYGFLAANALILGALAFTQRRFITAALALIAVAGAVTVVLSPTQFWFASAAGFAPFWIALLVLAAREALAKP
jgi:hypothetical protein